MGLVKAVLGLKSATEEEINSYKGKLTEAGVKFEHKTEGLPHNGVIKVVGSSCKMKGYFL